MNNLTETNPKRIKKKKYTCAILHTKVDYFEV